MCGAALAPAVTWCPRCYTPVEVDPDETESLLGEIDPLPVPAVRSEKWRPQRALVQPGEPKLYSRVGASATTFGWAGRFAFSVFFFAVALFVFEMSGGGVMGFVGAGALTPLYVIVFRDLWKKGRVR